MNQKKLRLESALKKELMPLIDVALKDAAPSGEKGRKSFISTQELQSMTEDLKQSYYRK